MRTLNTLAFIGLSLASTAVRANDFRPLMEVVRETWPDKHHIGVLCDYQAARDEVQALAVAAGPNALITVADTRYLRHIAPGTQAIQRCGADYVVLLPHGGVVRDGSMEATFAIRRLANAGVPTLSTRPIALSQGAIFAVGPETDGQVMTADKLIGTIDVILPKTITIIRKVQFTPANAPTGAAQIQVLSLEGQR